VDIFFENKAQGQSQVHTRILLVSAKGRDKDKKITPEGLGKSI